MRFPTLNPRTRLQALLLAIVAALLVAVGVYSVVEEVTEPSGIEVLRHDLEALPTTPMTQEEVNGVFYSFEGQKLAHDFQSSLVALWGAKVFEEAAANSQVRMDAVSLLFPRLGLVQPDATPGQFRDPHLAELYAQFTVEAAASELSALTMSAELSELNILDLQTQMDLTDNEDIRLVYRHVLEASGVQLWAFARAVERFGGYPYEPRFLTALGFGEIMEAAGKPGEGSRLLLPRPRECGKEFINEVSRHSPAGRGDETALRTRFCTSEVDVFNDPISVPTNNGAVQVRFYETYVNQFPAVSDSNSPAFWYDGGIRVINSDPSGSYISGGPGIDELGESVPVQLPVPERPGTAWMEATWTDPETRVLYGWYHFEPNDLDCYPLTAPLIGAAVSYDGGMSWQDQGFILDNPYGHDCAFDNEYFVGGSGDFSVILGPGGEYFYFLFSTYIGPTEEVGVAIARSAYEERGQPGAVWKYFEGMWEEPGTGGRNSALLPSAEDWAGPEFDAFWGPSVHWNTYLQKYVILLNRSDSRYWHQEGIYIAFSDDLVTWTAPEKVMESNDWYPQVVGLGANGTDSIAGRYMRMFVGGLSRYVMEFSYPQAAAQTP